MRRIDTVPGGETASSAAALETVPARAGGKVGSPAVAAAGDSARNVEIEVLRAIAILLTVFSHWIYPLLPSLGAIGRSVHASTAMWTGVDLFFCISGFVIADSLLRQRIDRPGLHAWREVAAPFWIRRAFRLLPSAWLWIALSLVVWAITHGEGLAGTLASQGGDALSALLNVANLWYIHCSPRQACGELGIYWSLSLEEQFYLLLPVLLFVVPNRRALVAVLAALAIAQVIVSRPNGFLEDGSAWWFLRTDAILFGVLIAFWRRTPGFAASAPTWLNSTWLRLAVIGALLVALATVASQRYLGGYGTGAAAVISAALVWIASHDAGYLMRDGALRRAAEWIGARSYAIYLIHLTSLELSTGIFRAIAGQPLSKASPVYAAAMLATTAVLTAIAAELNFRYIETPLRERGRRIARGIERRASERPA